MAIMFTIILCSLKMECGSQITIFGFKMMLKNWKEFGIDIKALNNRGETILDIINHSDGRQEIKKMLGEEYYKMI